MNYHSSNCFMLMLALLSNQAFAADPCRLTDEQIAQALSDKDPPTALVVEAYGANNQLITHEFRFMSHFNNGEVDEFHSIQYYRDEGAVARSWMDGDWTVLDLDGVIYRLKTEEVLDSNLPGGFSLREKFAAYKGFSFSPEDFEVPEQSEATCGESKVLKLRGAALARVPAPFGIELSPTSGSFTISSQLRVVETQFVNKDGTATITRYLYGKARSFGLKVPSGGKRTTLRELMEEIGVVSQVKSN